MSNQEYFCFFKKMFDLWIEDEKRLGLKQIKEIYDIFAKCLEPNYLNKDCACGGKCFENFISLDINGNLYSCNRTYNDKKFYYGNINDISIDELKKTMKEMAIKRKSYIEKSKCKQCILFDECNGGCPANANNLHNTILSSDDYFCEAKIKIKRYILKKINDMKLKDEYIEGLNKRG